MIIEKYQGDACLIIPIHQLISLTFIEFVIKLAWLFLTYKYWPIKESDKPNGQPGNTDTGWMQPDSNLFRLW